MPKAEYLLWVELKNKQLGGYKFRRQYSVGSFVVDFYCPKLKLAIEVDGDSHFGEEQIKYDIVRQEIIESFDIQVLRFTNDEIYGNLNEVIEEIRKYLL